MHNLKCDVTRWNFVKLELSHGYENVPKMYWSVEIVGSFSQREPAHRPSIPGYRFYPFDLRPKSTRPKGPSGQDQTPRPVTSHCSGYQAEVARKRTKDTDNFLVTVAPD
jgi:hypothetical protein